MLKVKMASADDTYHNHLANVDDDYNGGTVEDAGRWVVVVSTGCRYKFMSQIVSFERQTR